MKQYSRERTGLKLTFVFYPVHQYFSNWVPQTYAGFSSIHCKEFKAGFSSIHCKNLKLCFNFDALKENVRMF